MFDPNTDNPMLDPNSPHTDPRDARWTCERCEVEYGADDSSYTLQGYKYELLCDSCYRETFAPCVDCGDEFPNPDLNKAGCCDNCAGDRVSLKKRGW